MLGFHTEQRPMPLTHGKLERTPMKVWCSQTGSWAVHFGTAGGGHSTSVWTTREGIEALRDSCNAALVRADCEPPPVIDDPAAPAVDFDPGVVPF